MLVAAFATQSPKRTQLCEVSLGSKVFPSISGGRLFATVCLWDSHVIAMKLGKQKCHLHEVQVNLQPGQSFVRLLAHVGRDFFSLPSVSYSK
jgi:hypothetical protein